MTAIQSLHATRAALFAKLRAARGCDARAVKALERKLVWVTAQLAAAGAI